MSPPSNPGKDQEWTISNEFARVRLTIDHCGNDPRLRIDDLTNDASVTLDAFLLAALTTAFAEDLARHVVLNLKIGDVNPHPGGFAQKRPACIVTGSIPGKLALLWSLGASGRGHCGG
jgi:hypothetical protein